MATATKAKRGNTNRRPKRTPVTVLPGRILGWPFKACDPPNMTTAGLFYPWELVDWRKVWELINARQAVCIEMPSGFDDDAEHNWGDCANEQLGCQNMRVMFRPTTDGWEMWIIPLSALENVTPGCHEMVYG